MANTFTKIASVTVGSGGASTMAFSSIPATYTDLQLLITSQTTSNNYIKININSDTGSNYTYKVIRGSGSAAGSFNQADWTGTAYVFGYSDSGWSSHSVYIPNYASSNYKSISSDSVQEANTTTAYSWLGAGLWSNTSAITAISIASQTLNFAQYSTATLYGIKNS
jgi:hypothetical protein